MGGGMKRGEKLGLHMFNVSEGRRKAVGVIFKELIPGGVDQRDLSHGRGGRGKGGGEFPMQEEELGGAEVRFFLLSANQQPFFWR